MVMEGAFMPISIFPSSSSLCREFSFVAHGFPLQTTKTFVFGVVVCFGGKRMHHHLVHGGLTCIFALEFDFEYEVTECMIGIGGTGSGYRANNPACNAVSIEVSTKLFSEKALLCNANTIKYLEFCPVFAQGWRETYMPSYLTPALGAHRLLRLWLRSTLTGYLLKSVLVNLDLPASFGRQRYVNAVGVTLSISSASLSTMAYAPFESQHMPPSVDSRSTIPSWKAKRVLSHQLGVVSRGGY